MEGLVHLYCGDGKGKSTAAVGLSVRASGAGLPVVFAQFFKDGSSSEIGVLRSLPGVRVLVCERYFGRFRNISEEARAEAVKAYGDLLEEALAAAGERGLLVLDEAVSACNHGVIREERLLDFLRHKPEELEVVLTGRNPSEALLGAADYVTEMRKLRHPFDAGIPARKGVEF